MTIQNLTACTRRSPRHRPLPAPTSSTSFGIHPQKATWPECREDAYKKYKKGTRQNQPIAKCTGAMNALIHFLCLVQAESLQRPTLAGSRLVRVWMWV